MQVELKPDYVTYLNSYRKTPCPFFNKKHEICRNRDVGQRLIRSKTQIINFNQTHGNTLTPVGHQIDHIVPLCLGGPDCPCNMQYLTESDHKIKTAHDLAACRYFKVQL